MLVRVFEMPEFSRDFCFNRDIPQTFRMVDWFRDDACPDDAQLITFIRSKRYFRESAAFLVLREKGSLTIGYNAP
jgi:hypothetical protein